MRVSPAKIDFPRGRNDIGGSTEMTMPKSGQTRRTAPTVVEMTSLMSGRDAAPTESEYRGFKTRLIHHIHEFITHGEDEDALTGSEFNQALVSV